MNSHDIHKANYRKALLQRRDPYWGAPIEQGRHIGIRKNANGSCNWIARRWDEDGKKYRFKALGQLSRKFDHSQAVRAARQWFKDADRGVSDTAPTVEEACRDYVADLRAEGRESAAHEADRRLERTIYGRPKGSRARQLAAHEIARVRLDRLRTSAVAHKRVNASVAQEPPAPQPIGPRIDSGRRKNSAGYHHRLASPIPPW